MPSNRKIDPCTTGMPSFTEASFTRNRVGKLSLPSTNHVVTLEDREHVVGAETHVVGHDVDVGVEQRQRLLRRVDLAVADALDVVQDLTLQVDASTTSMSMIPMVPTPAAAR